LEITEIRIKLMEGSEDRLRAFCSITIDGCFVVRDLKIIDGTNGPFVAMPSRKLTGHCQRCGHKNHLRATYCNHCGVKLQIDGDTVYDSPQKLYADVAHPINSECRELIQNAVIEEFEAELSRSSQPGYRSRYDDEFSEDLDPGEAKYLDPGESRKQGGGPPKPHFMEDRPSRESTSAEKEPPEEDDSFGAGVF
jgi:stage V sporulation protein G